MPPNCYIPTTRPPTPPPTYLPPTTKAEGYFYPVPKVQLVYTTQKSLPIVKYLPPSTTTTTTPKPTTPVPTYLPPVSAQPKSSGYFYPKPDIPFEF